MHCWYIFILFLNFVLQVLDSALDFLQGGESESENGLEDEEEDDETALYEIYEESPDIEIPYDLIAQLELAEAKAASSKLPSAASISKATILAAVEKWKLHPEDVGSVEVQIVTTNERVKYLTKHLLSNKKDKAAIRGLDAIVNKRRRLLNYLYEHNQPKAELMISELGIRFRPPGQLWDKETKYGAFKNTKSKWKQIRAEKKALRPTSASSSQ